MKKSRSVLTGFLGCFLVGVVATGKNVSQSSDSNLLIHRIAERMELFPEYSDWEAYVITRITEMDKNWKPKKRTIIHKRVRSVGNTRSEDILHAVETKKDESKDVTEKYRERARKAEEKAAREEDNKDKNGGSFSVNLEELFPFSDDRRDRYDFKQEKDDILGGEKVHVFSVRAKEKTEKMWEGKYYFDTDDLLLLKFELSPAKTPRFVKNAEMAMTFAVGPQGHFIFKTVKMLINGGIFIKHIRMVYEEEYSEFNVLEHRPD